MTERVGHSLMHIDPQALLLAAIEKDSGIETLERLVALAKDVRAVQAKEAWHEAMAGFHRACPEIFKTEEADIGGKFRYHYAPLDEIMTKVRPVLGQLGLSVSWRTPRVEPDKVVRVCRISHALGHYEESGEIVIPIGGTEDRSAATAAQRVGIAISYAERYSVKDILGLAPEDDDDATDHEKQQQRQDESLGERQLNADAVITENQVRRFSAIASGMKWSDDQVHDLIAGFQYNSRKDILVKDYEKIVERLKQGPNPK